MSQNLESSLGELTFFYLETLWHGKMDFAVQNPMLARSSKLSSTNPLIQIRHTHYCLLGEHSGVLLLDNDLKFLGQASVLMTAFFEQF